MKIVDIAFSAYPVTDMVRARAFYEGVLGLKPTMLYGEPTPVYVEYDIGSSTLSIGAGMASVQPSKDGGTVVLEVEDFAVAKAHLEANGVKIAIDAFETPVCHALGMFDPDGNSLMIHQRKVR